MSNVNLTLHIFMQLVCILAVCHIVGLAVERIGQPRVVGEMIAGVVMGPSLLGLIVPGLQMQLFPKGSMGALYVLSQVGLVLYMFLIGLEFRLDFVRDQFRRATAISLAGILAPFTLGCLLTLSLVTRHGFFTHAVSIPQAMVFLGASMSITAFPMLARIIHDRGLTGSRLGTLALAAGSIDDAAAWCLLAIVLASFTGDARIGFLAIGGGAVYVAGVFLVGKPLLRRLGTAADRAGIIGAPMLSVVATLVLLSAWVTETIGLGVVFGAFLLGVAMPRGILSREIPKQLGPVVTSLLLPLFFAYSGLNTRIGLISTVSLFAITVVVILAACLGKGAACWVVARVQGESNSDALTIGALMNARGLMELIILNIGLEQHIITPTLFTIMVLMAVVTTLAASPVYEFAFRRRAPTLANAPMHPLAGTYPAPFD